MSFGTIQAREFSKNGKLKLKIDGKWMYVGRCNVDGLDQGSYVEYTSETFGDRNNLIGLQTIRPAQPPAQSQAGYPPSQNSGGVPALNSPPPPACFDGDELRFISNVVGSAIMAKSAGSPTDVKGWALAAREALQALKGPTPQREPGNDDDYESENPAPQNTAVRNF